MKLLQTFLITFLLIAAAMGVIFIFSFKTSKPVEENTVNKNSDFNFEWFRKKLYSLERYGDSAVAVYEYKKRTERWTKGFIINNPDDHGFAKYIVTEINDDGVSFSYESIFSHLSFGKNLISRDCGRFKLPWIIPDESAIDLNATINR